MPNDTQEMKDELKEENKKKKNLSKDEYERLMDSQDK